MRREGVGRGCEILARVPQCCHGGRAGGAALHFQSVPARGPCRSWDEGPIHGDVELLEDRSLWKAIGTRRSTRVAPRPEQQWTGRSIVVSMLRSMRTGPERGMYMTAFSRRPTVQMLVVRLLRQPARSGRDRRPRTQFKWLARIMHAKERGRLHAANIIYSTLAK